MVNMTMNIAILILYLTIYETEDQATNDPGFTIWYLCCLKVGQRGKYLDKSKSLRLSSYNRNSSAGSITAQNQRENFLASLIDGGKGIKDTKIEFVDEILSDEDEQDT